MANGSGAQGGPDDQAKYFCHSCGGVTVHLTPAEADDDRARGHDLEAFPLQPRAALVVEVGR